jgi:hypothetical protein
MVCVCRPTVIVDVDAVAAMLDQLFRRVVAGAAQAL